MKDTLTWYCYAVQYWKDGKTRISEMDDIFSTLDRNPERLHECFMSAINLRMTSNPSFLIYDGVRIPRTTENDIELKEFEKLPENQIKHMGYPLLEIWQYSFRDEGEVVEIFSQSKENLQPVG